MNARRSAAQSPAPATIITVPASLAGELEQLVEGVARRTGEPIEDVRRAVEVTVLQNGIDSLKREEARRR